MNKHSKKKKVKQKTLYFPKIEFNDPMIHSLSKECRECMGDFKLEKSDIDEVVNYVNTKG